MAKRDELELEHPSARCGHCGFTAAVAGEWAVEDGRLVFRAEADPLPGRGPSLFDCCESDEVAEFGRLSFDYGQKDFSKAELEALRVTARKVRDERYAGL